MLLKVLDQGMIVILFYAVLAAATRALAWLWMKDLHGLVGFAVFFALFGISKLCEDDPGAIRPILWSLPFVLLSFVTPEIAWFLAALSSIWILAFLFATPERRKLAASVLLAKTKDPNADHIRILLTVIASLAAIVFAVWALRTGDINQYAGLAASCYAGLYLARKGAEIGGSTKAIGSFVVKQVGQLALIAAIVTTFGMLLAVALRHWQADITLQTLILMDKYEKCTKGRLDHTLHLSGWVVMFYLAALISVRTWVESRRLNKRVATGMDDLWKAMRPVLKGMEVAKYALTVALSFTFLSHASHGPVDELRLIINRDKQDYVDLRRKAQTALEIAAQQTLYQRSWEAAPPELKAAINDSNTVYASRRELDRRYDMELDDNLVEIRGTDSGKTQRERRARLRELIDAIPSQKPSLASDAKEDSDYALVTGARLSAAQIAVDKVLSSLTKRIPKSFLEGPGEEFTTKLMGLGLSPEPIYKHIGFLKPLTSDYPWIAKLFDAMADAVNDAVMEKLKEKAAELSRQVLESPAVVANDAVAKAADQLMPPVKIESSQYSVDWAREAAQQIEELRSETKNEVMQFSSDVEASKRVRAGAAQAKAEEIKNSFREQLSKARRIHADFEKLKSYGYRGRDRGLERDLERVYQQQGLLRDEDLTQHSLDNLGSLMSWWTHDIALVLMKNPELDYGLDHDLRKRYEPEEHAIRLEEMLHPGVDQSSENKDKKGIEFK